MGLADEKKLRITVDTLSLCIDGISLETIYKHVDQYESAGVLGRWLRLLFTSIRHDQQRLLAYYLSIYPQVHEVFVPEVMVREVEIVVKPKLGKVRKGVEVQFSMPYAQNAKGFFTRPKEEVARDFAFLFTKPTKRFASIVGLWRSVKQWLGRLIVREVAMQEHDNSPSVADSVFIAAQPAKKRFNDLHIIYTREYIRTLESKDLSDEVRIRKLEKLKTDLQRERAQVRSSFAKGGVWDVPDNAERGKSLDQINEIFDEVERSAQERVRLYVHVNQLNRMLSRFVGKAQKEELAQNSMIGEEEDAAVEAVRKCFEKIQQSRGKIEGEEWLKKADRLLQAYQFVFERLLSISLSQTSEAICLARIEHAEKGLRPYIMAAGEVAEVPLALQSLAEALNNLFHMQKSSYLEQTRSLYIQLNAVERTVMDEVDQACGAYVQNQRALLETAASESPHQLWLAHEKLRTRYDDQQRTLREKYQSQSIYDYLQRLILQWQGLVENLDVHLVLKCELHEAYSQCQEEMKQAVAAQKDWILKRDAAEGFLERYKERVRPLLEKSGVFRDFALRGSFHNLVLEHEQQIQFAIQDVRNSCLDAMQAEIRMEYSALCEQVKKDKEGYLKVPSRLETLRRRFRVKRELFIEVEKEMIVACERDEEEKLSALLKKCPKLPPEAEVDQRELLRYWVADEGELQRAIAEAIRKYGHQFSGVSPEERVNSVEEIKRLYRVLTLKYHPDKTPYRREGNGEMILRVTQHLNALKLILDRITECHLEEFYRVIPEEGRSLFTLKEEKALSEARKGELEQAEKELLILRDGYREAIRHRNELSAAYQRIIEEYVESLDRQIEILEEQSVMLQELCADYKRVLGKQDDLIRRLGDHLIRVDTALEINREQSARNGEQLARNGEQLARNGEQLARNGEQLAINKKRTEQYNEKIERVLAQQKTNEENLVQCDQQLKEITQSTFTMTIQLITSPFFLAQMRAKGESFADVLKQLPQEFQPQIIASLQTIDGGAWLQAAMQPPVVEAANLLQGEAAAVAYRQTQQHRFVGGVEVQGKEAAIEPKVEAAVEKFEAEQSNHK